MFYVSWMFMFLLSKLFCNQLGNLNRVPEIFVWLCLITSHTFYVYTMPLGQTVNSFADPNISREIINMKLLGIMLKLWNIFLTTSFCHWFIFCILDLYFMHFFWLKKRFVKIVKFVKSYFCYSKCCIWCAILYATI